MARQPTPYSITGENTSGSDQEYIIPICSAKIAEYMDIPETGARGTKPWMA